MNSRIICEKVEQLFQTIPLIVFVRTVAVPLWCAWVLGAEYASEKSCYGPFVSNSLLLRNFLLVHTWTCQLSSTSNLPLYIEFSRIHQFDRVLTRWSFQCTNEGSMISNPVKLPNFQHIFLWNISLLHFLVFQFAPTCPTMTFHFDRRNWARKRPNLSCIVFEIASRVLSNRTP